MMLEGFDSKSCEKNGGLHAIPHLAGPRPGALYCDGGFNPANF